MNFLINCSNLKKGGGLQVADSVIHELANHPEHNYTVVYSDGLTSAANDVKDALNIRTIRYNTSPTFKRLLTGKDPILDNLVIKNKINAVLTVFGPPTWTPRCPHLCGFARAHIVLTDSPYFQRMSVKNRMLSKIHNEILMFYFKRGVNAYWTENPMISELVKNRVKKREVITITNTFNQVFNHFNCKIYRNNNTGKYIFLTVNAPYPHKNMGIAIEIAQILRRKHPEFSFEFTMTLDSQDLPEIPPTLKSNFNLIGKQKIQDVPLLYENCDVMFQPTLLECFSATYAEAMVMKKPIVTTDLPFARGLCGDAALYYSPLNASEAADALYKAANDKALRSHLILEGEKELKKFDTYSQRTTKLIVTLEKLSNNR